MAAWLPEVVAARLIEPGEEHLAELGCFFLQAPHFFEFGIQPMTQGAFGAQLVEQ